MTTLAGSLAGTVGTNNYGRADGVGTAASFYGPLGVAVNAAGATAIIVRGARRRSCVASRGGGLGGEGDK